MELQQKLLTGIDVKDKLAREFKRFSFVIAGGAVRDSVLDKPISDIDMYTSLPIHTDRNFIKKLVSFFPTAKKIYRMSIDQYHRWHSVAIEMSDGTEIQLIHMPTTPVIKTIMNFDIGLCMCYLSTAENKLILPEEFKRDRDNKTLTVYPDRLSSSQIVRSFEYHLPKLLKKYPDYQPRVKYDE